MRGLTIVFAGLDRDRLHAALSLAAAQAALGGRARIFLQSGSVALVRSPLTAPSDARNAAAGLPSLAQLLEDALQLGVEIVACQGGLALCGLTLADLDRRISAGGLVSLLAEIGEDRLLFA